MKSDPLLYCGSRRGGSTLDQGDGGGNPFASSLIEILGRPTLTLKNLTAELPILTAEKSRGFQQAQVPDSLDSELSSWQVLPPLSGERRVALILVYSDFSSSDFLSSLAGAENDARRVAAALEPSGFRVNLLLDPAAESLELSLEQFRILSGEANAAMIYATGHGVEIDEGIYLLPSDFTVEEGKAKNPRRGLALNKLGSVLQAKNVNLLFYGGCRTDPFRDRSVLGRDG